MPLMVRTLHLWLDDSTAYHILPLFNLCKQLQMASITFPEPTSSASWRRAMSVDLCGHLERLDQLKILLWETCDHGMDQHMLLVPLLSINLPHLESLRISSISEKDTRRPTERSLDVPFRATLPSLRYLDLCYSECKEVDTAEPPDLESREKAVRYMHRILASLLDDSPHIASLGFSTNVLNDQMCHALPLAVSGKLEHLWIRDLDGSLDGRNALDITPLSLMSRLSTFSSDRPIDQRAWIPDTSIYQLAWNSLPMGLTDLELAFDSTQELDQLTQFLNNPSNLPILRKLSVQFYLRRFEGVPNPMQATELDEQWERTLSVAHARGLRASLASAVHNAG